MEVDWRRCRCWGVGGRETSLTLRLINKINTCARRGLEPMSASVAVFLVKRNGATRYIDWHNTPPPTTRRQRCSIQPPRPNPCSSACCCYYRGVKLAANAKHAYTHTRLFKIKTLAKRCNGVLTCGRSAVPWSRLSPKKHCTPKSNRLERNDTTSSAHTATKQTRLVYFDSAAKSLPVSLNANLAGLPQLATSSSPLTDNE